MKKLLKILLVAIVLAALLIALFPTVAGGFIRSKVESGLAASMDAEVSTKDFSFGWVSGLSISDLKIDGRGADATDYEIGQLDAKPALFSLLSGSVVIDDLRAERVVIHHRAAAKKAAKPKGGQGGDSAGKRGKSAPKKVAKESGGAELPHLDVNAVLRDLTVIYEDPAYDAPMRLESLKEIRVALKSGEPVQLTIEDPAISIDATVQLFDGKRVRAANKIDVDATVRSEDADLGRFKAALAPWIDLQNGRLTIDEKITRKNGSLKIVGTAKASNLAFHDKTKSGQHRVQSLDLTSNLSLDEDFAPSGSLNFQLDDLKSEGMDGFDDPVEVTTASLEADIKPGQILEVKKASLKGDLADLDAAGTLDYSGTYLKGDFDLTLKAALDKLSKLGTDPREMSGRLTSRMKLSTAQDGLVTLAGSTTIDDLRAAPFKEGMAPLSEKKVVLKHDLTVKDDEIQLQDVRLDASFAKARATGGLKLGDEDDAPTGKIDINADADLDGLMALVGDLMPATLSGRINLVGALEGRADGLGFTSRLTGNRVDVTHASLGEAPMSLGRVDITADGRMNQEKTDLQVSKLILNTDISRLSGSMRQTTPEEGDGTLTLKLAGTADINRLANPFLETPINDAALRNARVALDLDKAGQTMTIRQGELRTGQTTATLTGNALLPEEGDMTASWNYSVNGRLDDLQGLASAFRSGRMAGGITARGSLTQGPQMRFSGKGQVSNLMMVGEIAGDRKISARRANFDLDVVLQDGLRDLQLRQADFNGTSLEPEEGAAIRGDFVATGNVQPDGAFSFNLQGRQMSVRPDGQPSFQAMKSPLNATLAGKRDADATSWEVSRLAIDADGIKAQGTMNYRPGERIRVATTSDLQMQGFATNWLGLYFDDVAGQGTGRLELDFDVPLGEDADRSSSTGRLVANMKQLRIGGVTMDDVVAKGRMRGGVGKLSEGTARVNNGTATLNLDLDLRPEDAIVDFSINAKDVEVVERFQPTIARVIPIFGGVGAKVETKVDLDMKLKGRSFDKNAFLNSLNGTGNFQAAKGSITGGPMLAALATYLKIPARLDFDALQTGIQIRDGAVHQEGLEINGNVLDLLLSGSTGFDGSLNYTLGVKPEPGRVKEWDRFGGILSDNGFLPLGLGGSVSAPGLRFPDPAKLIQGAIENRVKDGIGNIIGGGDPKKALEGLLGGKKKDPKDADGKKDPKKDPLGGLSGLLGGKKKKDGDAEKKKKKPEEELLEGLGGLLGGKKKKKKKKKPDDEN